MPTRNQRNLHWLMLYYLFVNKYKLLRGSTSYVSWDCFFISFILSQETVVSFMKGVKRWIMNYLSFPCLFHDSLFIKDSTWWALACLRFNGCQSSFFIKALEVHEETRSNALRVASSLNCTYLSKEPRLEAMYSFAVLFHGLI